MFVRLGEVKADLPAGWCDTTHEVDAEDPPFTLTKPDGVGALQFSFAIYQGGKVPDPSPEVLRRMLVGFIGSGRPARDFALESEPLRLAAASYNLEGDFVRAWYVSDGANFAQITYLCDPDHVGEELAEAEQIVRSLVFASGE